MFFRAGGHTRRLLASADKSKTGMGKKSNYPMVHCADDWGRMIQLSAAWRHNEFPDVYRATVLFLCPPLTFTQRISAATPTCHLPKLCDNSAIVDCISECR